MLLIIPQVKYSYRYQLSSLTTLQDPEGLEESFNNLLQKRHYKVFINTQIAHFS